MQDAGRALLVRTRLTESDATNVSYRWAGTVKEHFESKKWMVRDLAADDAVRTKVEEALKEEYNYWIDYYILGDGGAGPESFRFAAALRHNRDALTLLGDKSATLEAG